MCLHKKLKGRDKNMNKTQNQVVNMEERKITGEE
jgi:hypothetical protein